GGDLLPVVIPVVPVGIGDDRLPAHLVERDLLGRRVPGGGNNDRLFYQVRVRDGPLERLHAAHRSAGNRVEFGNVKNIEETFLGVDHIADGHHREGCAVGPASSGVYG